MELSLLHGRKSDWAATAPLCHPHWTVPRRFNAIWYWIHCHGMLQRCDETTGWCYWGHWGWKVCDYFSHSTTSTQVAQFINSRSSEAGITYLLFYVWQRSTFAFPLPPLLQNVHSVEQAISLAWKGLVSYWKMWACYFFCQQTFSDNKQVISILVII